MVARSQPRARSVARVAAIVLACALGTAGAAGCGASAAVAASPSTEPSTASILSDEGLIALELMPPQGEWKVRNVDVKNARVVERGKSNPLNLQVRRSQAQLGETTVEGANEPIEVTVEWGAPKGGGAARVVYRIATPAEYAAGAKLKVDVTW